MSDLKGVRVAILMENGFEQAEMTEPRKALEEAGAETKIVSPQAKNVRGWQVKDWGDEFPVDESLDNAQPANFDALLLPGGVMNPDHLRMNPKAVAFVKAFFDAKKPVAAICHGPWTIIEAGVAKGRQIASWPSLKTDLRNAGAEWVDHLAVERRKVAGLAARDQIPVHHNFFIKRFGEPVGGQKGMLSPEKGRAASGR